VAAKTLLHAHFPGTFHVTVYEAKTRIGGLWPTSQDDDGMVNPEMCTNQSKHTVSFSDFAWEDSTPQFPKAWMVGRYLERYLKCYPVHDIRLGMEVVTVEPRGEGWDVVARGGSGVTTRERYDFVVIATGFFGKPRIPSTLEAWELGAWRPARFPVWHSSRFRSVEKFLTDDGEKKPTGTKIVVVGGQMSGVEVAASIAMQLSSEVHTPGSNRILDAGKYEVVHIVQQPAWVMPLYFPNNPQLPEDAESGSEKVNFSFLEDVTTVLTTEAF
jgi:cation diffusion facilitator CzcD-associated flavoprotein CzcO